MIIDLNTNVIYGECACVVPHGVAVVQGANVRTLPPHPWDSMAFGRLMCVCGCCKGVYIP